MAKNKFTEVYPEKQTFYKLKNPKGGHIATLTITTSFTDGGMDCTPKTVL